MCGIVGYVGSREAATLLVDGLRRLEYRGYDSCGIAILNGGAPHVVRAMGRISALEENQFDERPAGRTSLRNRTHPLGDTWRPEPRECTSSS
jgi:glucosamine--fructose-6-phosphate aminotransferase (isomerizing)